jgi:hypothetical protein
MLKRSIDRCGGPIRRKLVFVHQQIANFDD